MNESETEPNHHARSNILLTPISYTNSTSSSSSSAVPNNSSAPFSTPTSSHTANTNLIATTSKSIQASNCHIHHHHHLNHLHHNIFQTPKTQQSVDFTDAKLLIERNTDGKHVVGKILLNPSVINNKVSTTTTTTTAATTISNQELIHRSSSQNSLTTTAYTTTSGSSESTNESESNSKSNIPTSPIVVSSGLKR